MSDLARELRARVQLGELTLPEAEREIKRRSRGQPSIWWPGTLRVWQALGVAGTDAPRGERP